MMNDDDDAGFMSLRPWLHHGFRVQKVYESPGCLSVTTHQRTPSTGNDSQTFSCGSGDMIFYEPTIRYYNIILS